MKFKYTKHQVPRGSLPDAVVGNKIYLIKVVSEMRLTYQIKALAFMAETRGKRLVIRLKKDTRVSPELRDFVRGTSGVVKIERG